MSAEIPKILDPRLLLGVSERLERRLYTSPAEVICAAVEESFDGEIYFISDNDRAKVCVYRGHVAWVYASGHGENLGHVLQREAGIAPNVLAQAMQEAKARKRMFGEWTVEQGLISREQLRSCLLNHLGNQLRTLAETITEFEFALVPQPYRYDEALTFDFDEIVTQSVFERVRSSLRHADGVVIVDPGRKRIVNPRLGAEFAPDDVLAEVAGRASLFWSRSGMRGASMFRGQDVVFCVLPLKACDHYCLVATCELRKWGRVLPGIQAIADRI